MKDIWCWWDWVVSREVRCLPCWCDHTTESCPTDLSGHTQYTVRPPPASRGTPQTRTFCSLCISVIQVLFGNSSFVIRPLRTALNTLLCLFKCHTQFAYRIICYNCHTLTVRFYEPVRNVTNHISTSIWYLRFSVSKPEMNLFKILKEN